MEYLEELKQQNLWVNYVLYPRKDGSMGKPPINPKTLYNASPTDANCWTDFETAKKNIGKDANFIKDGEKHILPINGTGVIMTGQYAGIDLDHVVKDGKIIAPFAQKLVDRMDTYTELSVSGTGLHLLMCVDDLTENIGGKYHVDAEGYYQKDGEYEVEVYAYPNKTGGRYLTVTENIYHDAPLAHGKGSDMRKIRDYYEIAKARNNVSENQQRSASSPLPSVGSLSDLPERTDAEVLERAYRSKRGEEIRRLYEGDTSAHNGDHSAADQALVNNLCYWCNGNEAQVDRIFRSSGLMRDKWDERRGSETYGQRTIRNALRDFTPYTRPEDSGLTKEKENVQQVETGQSVDNNQVPNVPDVNARELTKLPPKEEKKQIKPLTYDNAVDILKNANDDSIEIPRFESFGKIAKIGQHDTVILAGETGSGKSMLALNLIESLNNNYAVMYFNLEMTTETVLRRMVSIHAGIEIDTVEGYKKDTETQKAVNNALKEITSRQPIYVENDRYKLEQIEDAIKQAVAIQESNGRKEPVIVFVDHVLLLRNVGKSATNYERYSGISEELRRIAVLNNCIVFVLTQQSRAGKADRDKEPELSSLKESGSFENDATHVCFVWRSGVDGRYYLVLRKNRKGESETRWELEIDFRTQTVKAPRLGLPLQGGRDIEDLIPQQTTNRPTRVR